MEVTDSPRWGLQMPRGGADTPHGGHRYPPGGQRCPEGGQIPPMQVTDTPRGGQRCPGEGQVPPHWGHIPPLGVTDTPPRGDIPPMCPRCPPRGWTRWGAGTSQAVNQDSPRPSGPAPPHIAPPLSSTTPLLWAWPRPGAAVPSAHAPYGAGAPNYFRRGCTSGSAAGGGRCRSRCVCVPR